jgi:hypothetical protein
VLGIDTDWLVPLKLNEEFCPQRKVVIREREEKRKPLRAFMQMIYKDSEI